jgi:hypothetical protein
VEEMREEWKTEYEVGRGTYRGKMTTNYEMANDTTNLIKSGTKLRCIEWIV